MSIFTTLTSKITAAATAVYTKVSPTLTAIKNVVLEGVEVVKAGYRAVKGLVETGRAALDTVVATVKMTGNLGKAFLYDLPSAIKQAAYDQNRATAIVSLKAAGDDFSHAGTQLMEGLKSGGKMFSAGLESVENAVSTGYHGLAMGYYTAATAYHTGALAVEGVTTVASTTASFLPSFSAQRAQSTPLALPAPANKSADVELAVLKAIAAA